MNLERLLVAPGCRSLRRNYSISYEECSCRAISNRVHTLDVETSISHWTGWPSSASAVATKPFAAAFPTLALFSRGPAALAARPFVVIGRRWVYSILTTNLRRIDQQALLLHCHVTCSSRSVMCPRANVPRSAPGGYGLRFFSKNSPDSGLPHATSRVPRQGRSLSQRR